MGDYNDAFMRNQNAAVQARTKAQNRANVLQSKMIGQSHPTGLTTNLLKLFEPRPPLEYKPPPEKRKCLPYTGMAQYVSKFVEPGDPQYAPPVQKGETPAQRRSRIHKLRLEEGAKKAAEELEKYDPSNDPNISGDPYKTLFVARLNYETTEHRIKREFEAYGPIKRVRTITDKVTNKPRGYAFIEYMHTRDMKAAYKQADGRKLDNRRVLVDVERGRTVPNWRPRRLGGGLGSTRVGGEEVNQKYSGREPQQVASGGPARSEEPRSREDRHDRERKKSREREKSRERGRDRDREREKLRERSYDRSRDRDSREERHHRDRDRDRNRDRERDRGRDRDRERDRGRDRDRDHGRDHDRDRDQDLERDRVRDQDRGHSCDRENEYVEPKRERDRRAEREREYDHMEPEHEREWYCEPVEPGHGQYDHYEHHQGPREDEPQEDLENQNYDRDYGRYDRIEPEDYRYEHAASESHERERTHDRDREYQRSQRSLSREYEH
ncbi:RNA recognition motif domain [Macleaya cordata]|uniref:RNA recognition motif domain n=1 Tax=Macleaya cordata TaxID=56857 RepID=A0A200Q228_MACCD|nr:RNA recognition motif domain [Macleaya cordata]